MTGRRHSPEQILGKLGEVEVALAKGQTVANAVKQIGVTGGFVKSALATSAVDPIAEGCPGIPISRGLGLAVRAWHEQFLDSCSEDAILLRDLSSDRTLEHNRTAILIWRTTDAKISMGTAS